MKRTVRILFLLLALLVAVGCSRQHTYERVLTDADSLVERNADSARQLLRHIPDVMQRGDADSRARYTLLMAQSGYVTYDSVPDDSLLHAAADHFEHTGDRFLLCRTLYYRAMNLYVHHQHDEALTLLKKGEQLAINLQDLLYMSKYHESLCMVNYQAHCDELMLKYAKLFLEDGILLRDTACIARGIHEVTIAQDRMEKQEKAEDHLMQIIPLLSKSDSLYKASVLTNIGCFFHERPSIILSYPWKHVTGPTPMQSLVIFMPKRENSKMQKDVGIKHFALLILLLLRTH